MIFQGPGSLALIRSYLERGGSLDNWQLNRGDFSFLEVRERTFSRLSCERAVIHDSRWESCEFQQPEYRQCSMERSRYDDCRMEEALFISCQLRETELKGSYLAGGVFRGCSAPRITIDRCRIRRVSLHEPEISRAKITRTSLVASLFTAVHESGITGVRKSEVDECLFVNCRFNGAFFLSSRLKNSLFLGCRFVDADWDMVEWENCRFADCTGLPRGVVNSPVAGDELKGISFRRWNRYIKE